MPSTYVPIHDRSPLQLSEAPISVSDNFNVLHAKARRVAVTDNAIARVIHRVSAAHHLSAQTAIEVVLTP